MNTTDKLKKRFGNMPLMVTVILGGIALILIMVIGAMILSSAARSDTERAIHSVSTLYLDELAGRREQVVANNLQNRIRDLNVALSLMTEEDLSDTEHLKAFQAKMKQLYHLEKFAFVDDDGIIYTSLGNQTNIDDYNFDHKNISAPEISVLNLKTPDKKVVIALPVSGITFSGKEFRVCFMEIDMKEMLQGASMGAGITDSTFSNIYTDTGVALSNTVLGGLAVEDNLLEALANAEFIKDSSYQKVLDDFKNKESGEVSFSYNGTPETLAYVNVEGTEWMLTYLIRESVISSKISSISNGIIQRSIIQSAFAAIVLISMFSFIILQMRKNADLTLAKETSEAENRVKQQEMEHQLKLQEKLLEQQTALNDALAAAEQANKAKTAFLSSMSHEIRTPMNAIIGLDNIALNDPETPEKTREYLEKIGTSAEHLLNLINDILDMSRIESGRMVLRNEEFSISKFIEAINTFFSGQCSDKGLQYSCRINGEIDDFYIGDSMKLKQVLINILGNAVKFTPSGGAVELGIRRKAQYDGKSTLEFTVRDTGIGISEEFMPHIFDTFAQEDATSTNKYGSSGLGLAITKNIVEMMNGNIQVESVKHEGTTFRICVTLEDSPHKKDDSGTQYGSMKDINILIIDDDPVDCEHGKLVLEKNGIFADTALSGAEGIEKIKLMRGRGNPYRLILVDWKMPELDGIETTKRIRSVVGDEAAIIILTAYKWDDILDNAMENGVDSFISKPLFASNISEEFESALKRKNIVKTEKNGDKDFTGKRILLAEDIEINAEIMKMILETRGIEVDVAVNGKKAVEMFEGHPENYYFAILMDMRMPEMDGLTATKVIRNLERSDVKEIPIIALTANAFDEDVQRSLQAGLNAHLTKPVEPDILFETLGSFYK